MDITAAFEQLDSCEEEFPAEAVNWLQANWDQAEPALLAEIDKAVENPLYNGGGLSRWAMYLCAKQQSAAAFDRYVRIAVLPIPQLDILLDDWITEVLHKFLALTCQGRVDQLKTVVESPTAYAFARGAALDALVYLYFHDDGANGEAISLQRISEYCYYLLDEGLEKYPAEIWDITAAVCARFGYGPALPLIRRAYACGLIDWETMDCAEENCTGNDASEPSFSTHEDRLKAPEEFFEHWLPMFTVSRYRELTDEELLQVVEDMAETVPVYPNAKEIGRNSPCPCGSGRKFKKCCIDRTETIPMRTLQGEAMPQKDIPLNRWLLAGYQYMSENERLHSLRCWQRFWQELKKIVPEHVRHPVPLYGNADIFQPAEPLISWYLDVECQYAELAELDDAIVREGKQFLEEFVRVFPDVEDEVWAYNMLSRARLQAQLGFFSEAQRETQEIINNWPDWPEAYMRLASLLTHGAPSQGIPADYEGALKQLENARERTEDEYLRRRLDEQIEHTRQVLKLEQMTGQEWVEMLNSSTAHLPADPE